MTRGDRIQELRKAKGLTLQELGDKVGVGASTVRKWENGIIETIRSDKIDRLCMALDVQPGYILDWIDTPAPYSDNTVVFDAEGNSGIGSRLSEIRNYRGMSVEELSELSGVAVSAIRKIENGAVNNPKDATLSKLAQALNTSAAYLLGENDSVEYHPEESNIYKKYISMAQLKEEEKVLVEIYRKLDLYKRVSLLSYAFDLEKAQNDKNHGWPPSD